MGKFENKFLSVLNEDDVPPVDAVDAAPADDAQSFAGSLDQPENADVDYLNGGTDSVLGFLRTDNKTGTIFDGVSDATKSEILDICERLASLNQIFKNLYIEKHK